MLLLRYLLLGVAIFPLACAEFTDLENFIRVLGSLDSNYSTVSYLNGSVFGKQPGKDLQKIFYYEGYNINRKIRQQDGTFLSLSREFVVYRHPNTAQILQVWVNIWTNEANEIFFVANDPVNAHLDSPSPSQTAPRGNPQYLIYNSDIVLEYPNPLTPDKYSNYSAGPIYDSVELFAFFANYTQLKFSQAPSVSALGTWIRKSEYLPWMEMSTTPGSLYYTTMYWKCNEGLSCVADDIMEIIKKYYPKYEDAPTQDEVPNETSWTVFKKVIDQRRQAGLPDIIIPQVNTSSNVHTMTNNVDERVLNILYSWPLGMTVNGSAWSEIPGKQSVCFFNIIGNLEFDLERLPRNDGYRVQLDGFVSLRDPTTGRTLSNNFTNPVTGKINMLPKSTVGLDLVFKNNSFYTIDIPSAEAVGLLGAQSMDGDSAGGDWSVNFIDLIFPYSELKKKAPSTAHLYGTVGTFSSWPAWMEMSEIPGNIVAKLTVSK